jgi:hypothetical protein
MMPIPVDPPVPVPTLSAIACWEGAARAPSTKRTTARAKSPFVNASQILLFIISPQQMSLSCFRELVHGTQALGVSFAPNRDLSRIQLRA